MPIKRKENCGICDAKKRLIITKDNKEKLVCDFCKRKRASDWQKNNRERSNERGRNYKRKNLERSLFRNRISKVKQIYGLSEDEYNDLVFKHDNKCAICGEEESISLKGTVWQLSIDHCHKTGKIRGLLCARCNVGLSKFRENIQFFKNAINYLNKNK